MTSAGGLTLKARGKVRDVYDLGERLLLVASDRISAFDCVLPTLIPGKGELLTRLSAFWFKTTASIAPNHMISCDLAEIQEALPSGVRLDPGAFGGRTMLVRKARRVDAECIVRGFLAGSAWKEYLARGSAGGRRLPPGLPEAARLEPAIFTPSTKADSGHDENISRERLAEMVGSSLAADLERLSLALFERARALCEAAASSWRTPNSSSGSSAAGSPSSTRC
jgi:phosphoribosylaminoimidazole-succinocarboxamide synthase